MNKEVSGKLRVGLYRIIGNDIPGLHGEHQSLINLDYILKTEAIFTNVDKIFILNRIVDPLLLDRLIALLKRYSASYSVIPFDLHEYSSVGYDLGSMPDSYFWFRKAGAWVTIVKNAAIRNFKNAYVCNNNGARNYALALGRKHYDWVMPWDGNCFLTVNAMNKLYKFFLDSVNQCYAVTPMQRLVDNNDIEMDGIPGSAFDEPQISFRFDARGNFNEERVYSNQSKVELLKRIKCPGPWDEKINLYPWRTLDFSYLPDAGKFSKISAVYRLFSGNVSSATDGQNRSHARGKGLVTLIDSLDTKGLMDRLANGAYKKELSSILGKSAGRIPNLSIDQSFVKASDEDSVDCYITLMCGLLTHLLDSNFLDGNFSREWLEKLVILPDPNFKEEHSFIVSYAKMISGLVISLLFGHYDNAIKYKIDIVMLRFFFQSNREKLEYSAHGFFSIDFMAHVSDILFHHLFRYDFQEDINKLDQCH